MTKVKFSTAIMQPSAGLNPEILQQQFDWRNGKAYTGNNVLVFADIKENVCWNRPLNSDVFVKQEEDGLFSYNLSLAWRNETLAWKASYNVLLNKDNLPIAGMIKVNPDWTHSQIKALNRLMIDGVYNTLIRLGVDKNKLQQPNNDLLYEGKKFCGLEFINNGDWISIDCFLTLKYKEDKEVFDRLTGQFVKHKSIAGILEETELFTKEEFITVLTEELQELLAKI